MKPQLLLGILLLVLTGCATGPAQVVSPTRTLLATPTSHAYTLRDVVSLPGWIIIVTDDYTANGDAAAGNLGQRLFIADLSLQNTSPRSVAPPAFTLTVDGEAEAPTSFFPMLPLPPEIPASQQAQGQLAWTVPALADQFRLATGSIYWLLSD